MTTTRNPIATVSCLQLRALVDALTEFGVDSDRVLARAGIARDRIYDPDARVSTDYDFAVWNAAIELSGDHGLALRVAQRFALGQFGSFEYLLHNCSTLAQGVKHANAFMRLLDDLAELELRIEGPLAMLRLSRRGGYPMPPQGVECTFAVLHNKARALIPAPASLHEVRFAHPRVAPLALYEAHFGCAVRFGAEANELVADARVAEAPLPGDPRLLGVLEEHARQKLERVPEMDPVLHDVRRHLLSQLRAGAPDLALLARGMHMSERTLRRRLQAAGTRYQDLLDNLRAQLAKEYVLQAASDAVNVSERLGFSDPSTFYRAFKRWTGMTPAQYQKQMLGRS